MSDLDETHGENWPVRTHTVWKYVIPWGGSSELKFRSVPAAKVVHAKLEHEGYHGPMWTLWAEVDTPPYGEEEHVVYVVGTGHPIPDDAGGHILTVEHEGFVWHLYQKVVTY